MGQTGAVRRPASTREWVGHQKAKGWLLIGIIVGVLVIALGVFIIVKGPTLGSRPLNTWAAWLIGIVVILAGVFIALSGRIFSQATVRINGDAFWWALWPSHRYVRRYRWDTVASVDLVEVNGLKHWLGWGYRWMPNKGTAVVLGNGSAIHLTFTNGKQFTITIDDAAAGVEYADAFVQYHQNPISHTPPEIPSASARAGGLGADASEAKNDAIGERIAHAVKSIEA
jgi:hypothetical protein